MLNKKNLLFLLLTSILLVNIPLTSCQKDQESPVTTSIQEVPGAEAIYLHEEYEMGVGGYMYVVYNPYLVFKDGSIYKNLATNIDKLHIEQSRQQEAEEWGTWQKKGKDIVIAWKDGDQDTWEEESWFIANPASGGETIKGDYHSISGGGNIAFGGSMMTFSSTNISFNGNKFTFESTGGGSSDAVSSYASQTKAGTYELNGYSITLRFNNGVVEKKFFYFYPDSKDVFGIGTRYYVPND
jgi:hypothetical protein